MTTSAKTSRRQVPALFKKIAWEPLTFNLDYGGGKFDDGSKYLSVEHQVENYVYDPHNRDEEYNIRVRQWFREYPAMTATLANVLNVLPSRQEIFTVLRDVKSLMAIGGTLYISVYEGDKSWEGKTTRDGWQWNTPLSGYLGLVQEVFGFGPNVTLTKGMIVAEKLSEVTSDYGCATSWSEGKRAWVGKHPDGAFIFQFDRPRQEVGEPEKVVTRLRLTPEAVEAMLALLEQSYHMSYKDLKRETERCQALREDKS